MNIGVMKSPPGSKFIRACFDACYKKASNMEPEKMRSGEIGANLVFPLVLKFGLESYIMPPVFFCPIDAWNFEDIIKNNLNFDINIPKESYAVHLWNQLWRTGLPSPLLFNIYKISERLKKYSKQYSRSFDFLKRFIDSKLGAYKLNNAARFDKDRIYSERTLYGKLQKTYLK
jgi:hypothetical protein